MNIGVICIKIILERDDEISIGLRKKIRSSFFSGYRKTPVTNDTFCMASSVMHRFTVNTPYKPMWFKTFAESYLLSGRLDEICDHNAMVASNTGRHDVRYLHIIYITLYIYVYTYIFIRV